MSLDHAILGRITDYDIDDRDVPQSILNAESLFYADRENLLNTIPVRASEYDIKFYLENLAEDEDPVYWRKVLAKIIDVYSMNSLKLFFGESYSNVDIRTETINLLQFLKIEFLNMLELGDIPKAGLESREKFGEMEIDVPYFMNFFLIYADRASYNSFKDQILFQLQQPVEEI